MQHAPTSRILMRNAMKRIPTPRIPTMPQICHDTPARLYAGTHGKDWIDEMAYCIEHPAAIYEHVIRLVEELDCDGLRLFVKPEPRKITRDGNSLIALDDDGNRTGVIDLEGGGGYRPDDAPTQIDTVDEAIKRCAAIEAMQTDEKLELLTEARNRVPDRFVASSPLGMTMNTYTTLRGREQAMVDLYEHPELVHDVFEVQVDTAIRLAKRLKTTGIDAFYIGDPAASASLISPAHFEQFCLPAYQRFCREFADDEVLIYIHVCGNSKPILEMLADTGADTVEPLDPLGGVEVSDAKRRIGDRVALMGGVNTLTLARGTPEEVAEEAKRKCVEGGPHGYILAAGDMVPPNTPIENLKALVEIAGTSAELFD